MSKNMDFLIRELSLGGLGFGSFNIGSFAKVAIALSLESEEWGKNSYRSLYSRKVVSATVLMKF
jgi:hypothetical protein